MPGLDNLFIASLWNPALEKFGAVTNLSVIVFDAHANVACGPVPSTPLHAIFEEHGYDPGFFRECADRCLEQASDRPAVVVAPYGMAVVGTSLILEGQIVGAAVAGYALVDFSQSNAIAQLARIAGIPFGRLWEVARRHQPVPQRRLILHGELLQVLGDTMLRENYRTRQFETMAVQLQKEMGAKDEFLAIVSHELRTPLTPILSWATILREAPGDPTFQQKAVDSIERNALQLTKLVDDLLDLNRVMLGKLPLKTSIHNVSDLLQSALDVITESAARKRIVVEYVESGSPLAVKGDAGRLLQIFSNVLSNSIKFTAPRGHIWISLSKGTDEAVVRIADDGEGIDPDFLPHAFDMFSQQEEGTRRTHSGLGIGLALVKKLVELHGGRTEITSAGVGHGTEVTIYVPVSDSSAIRSSGQPLANGGRPPLRDLSILVIEDARDSLEAIRMMLEILGAKVMTAGDGSEALEVLAASRPDLVLCDLRMPHMDGYEFLSELNRTRGSDHPPVVAMTGLVSEADHRSTEEAGFVGHISKPFDGPTLVSAVNATLHRTNHIN